MSSMQERAVSLDASLWRERYQPCGKREKGMSNRDTQFAGFAKLLWKEIDQVIEASANGEEMEQKVCALLSQRSYDFARHVAREVEIEMLSHYSPSREEIMDAIDDLAEWPQSAHVESEKQA